MSPSDMRFRGHNRLLYLALRAILVALPVCATACGPGFTANLDDEQNDVPAQDFDGDGYPLPEDCDDGKPDVNPGMIELPCDKVDNDCDSWTPETCTDSDADADADADSEGGSDTGSDSSSETDSGADADADADLDIDADADACVPRNEVCADCVDQDCNGGDTPCDAGASLTVAPLSPAVGQNFTVQASAGPGFVWVLLRVEDPAGTVRWLNRPAVSNANGLNFWSWQVAGAQPGQYDLTFTRDNRNDNNALGRAVVCGSVTIR